MGGEWWFAFFKDGDDNKTKVEQVKGSTSSSSKAPQQNKGHNAAAARLKFDVKKY